MLFMYVSDILVIANDVLQGASMSGAKWTFLKDTMGLTDVKKMIEDGEWAGAEPKVLVLITGREEAVERHPALLNVVRNTVELIRKVFPNTVVLLCAPVPSPRDGPFALAELDGLADILQRKCRESEYLEFSRLGTHFYTSKRVLSRGAPREEVFLLKKRYMNQYGITEEGMDLIMSKLIDKFDSAKLLERFELLLKRPLVDLA